MSEGSERKEGCVELGLVVSVHVRGGEGLEKRSTIIRCLGGERGGSVKQDSFWSVRVEEDRLKRKECEGKEIEKNLLPGEG